MCSTVSRILADRSGTGPAPTKSSVPQTARLLEGANRSALQIARVPLRVGSAVSCGFEGCEDQTTISFAAFRRSQQPRTCALYGYIAKSQANISERGPAREQEPGQGLQALIPGQEPSTD